MDNHKIVVDKNGTTTLATKDTWCDRDVEIVTQVSDNSPPLLQNKSATPTKETQTFAADAGYEGIGTFTVNPIPSQYIVPSGTKSITSNGTHDVTDKASVNVNVPIPSGYIVPSGTAQITTNGTHNVRQYESATVNVPIPSGYIKPSGMITIASNGTHDVTNYASAVVNVSSVDGMVFYGGTASIGTYDSESSYIIHLGITLPERFYFFATCTDTSLSADYSSLTAYQYKHTIDGANYVTVNAANGTAETKAMDNCLTVWSERSRISIMAGPDVSKKGTLRSGTWVWLVMVEG